MKNIRVNVEIAISCVTVAACLAYSLMMQLPLTFPAAESAAFFGLHYIYPLMAIAIFGTLSAVENQPNPSGPNRKTILVSVACYAVVIYVYFSVKLWIPHIRSETFDHILWTFDLKLHWMVQFCMDFRRYFSTFVPFNANAYMTVYIGAFYIGFVGQARMAPEHLRELIIACMLMQVIGTLGYLAFPAVGPFIYETGVNPFVTRQQEGMLEFYQNSIAAGPDWLRIHGSSAFTAGLAAMPSLHVCGMTVFFLNAWRRTRSLAPVFGVMLAFIVISSIANRWHYLLDVPAGMLVAFVSLWLAEKLIEWDKGHDLSLRWRRTPVGSLAT